jgi:hypothetical protein
MSTHPEALKPGDTIRTPKLGDIATVRTVQPSIEPETGSAVVRVLVNSPAGNRWLTYDITDTVTHA